jgi:hypothetical protein
MSPGRVAVASTLVATVLGACTFTRPLDYLASSADGGESGGGGDAARRDGGAGDETGIAPPQLTGEIVAAGQSAPLNLAQDADNLYWSVSDNTIVTAPKGGGEPRPVGTAPGLVDAIAADPAAGGDLFVIAGEKVVRIAKSGGAATVIDGESPRPRALVVDDRYVFVLHAEDDFGEGTILRFKKDGSERAILSVEADTPVAIALHGPSVLWAGSDVDGELVVFSLARNAPDDAGATAQIYKGGSAGIDVKTKRGLAVDDQAIYYLAYDTETVRRVLRMGSPAPVTILSGPSGADITAIAIDAEHVYALDERAGGGILRASKSGATVEPFVPNVPVPTSLVVDGRALYYTVQGVEIGAKGSVLRVPTGR